MNDRFKFRMWDKYREEYIYFDFTSLSGALADIEVKIIEQCTGLKDKNGKLIYEGDIIKSPWGSLYEIRWDSIQARFQNHCGHLLLDTDIERYEIIGNIHQKDAK